MRATGNITMSLWEAQAEFPRYMGKYVSIRGGDYEGRSGYIVGYDCDSVRPWILKVTKQVDHRTRTHELIWVDTGALVQHSNLFKEKRY